MKSVALTAYPRAALGRIQVTKRRAAGRVPAVIYGRKIEPQALEVGRKELDEVIQHSASESALIDLSIEGETSGTRLALVKEVQHHPLTRNILHVDFQEVAADEQVTVTVPVETTGEAAGVKAGGVLEHVRFNVELRGLPRELPEVLLVDVSALGVGEVLTIGDLPCPEGVVALGDPDIPVILVAAPTKETETAPAEGEVGTSAEPEVLSAKKSEEGGA